MKDLQTLKDEILKDGVIDAAEVKEIESVIYADGKIDQEEADFLFELNDAVSGNANDPSWQDLFVKAVSSFVLDDENSPGELDEEEVNYLVDQIQGDGTTDDVEKALLNFLKNSIGKLPESLENLLN